MGKRCVSKCRKVKEEACVYPCGYVKGEKTGEKTHSKGYCRLASTLKMLPPDCNVVSKKESKRGSKKMFFQESKQIKKSRTRKKLRKPTRLCVEGLCVMDSLRTFFKQTTFDYEVSRTHNRIEYARGKYKAYARFQKGTIDAYTIGKALRPYLKQVPVLLDTFGIQGKSKDCQKEVNLLVETLPGQSLREIHQPHFYIYDALYVFYQIYAALTMIPFTHGNLTCDTVQVYELPGYIEYHYPECRFQSKYVVKLTNYENSTLEGVERCIPARESKDIDLLRDYAQVSQMKPHANKYIQGFVDVFESTHVSEAEQRFRALIVDPVRQRINQKSQSGDKLGDLYVRKGRSMEFFLP